MVEGIDSDLLRRYTKMRRKIDHENKTVYAISNLLSMFDHFGEDRVLLDMEALSHVNQLMNRSILKMWELMDDFIPIVHAEMVLDQLDETSSSSVAQNGK